MAVFLAFALIEQIIKTYEGPKAHCTKGWLFEVQDSIDGLELCDTTVLGTFIRSAKLGLTPPPSAPYTGITIKYLIW